MVVELGVAQGQHTNFAQPITPVTGDNVIEIVRIPHPVAEQGDIGIDKGPDTTLFARLNQAVSAQAFAIDKGQILLSQAPLRAARQPFAVAQAIEQIAPAGQDAPPAFGSRKPPEMTIIAVSSQGLDNPEYLCGILLVAE